MDSLSIACLYAKKNSDKQDHTGSWMQSLSLYGSGVSIYGARDENGTVSNQPSSVTVAELIMSLLSP